MFSFSFVSHGNEGGDVTATDEGGFTAADLALVHQKLPCLALLEKAGATVTAWRDTRTTTTSRGRSGSGGAATKEAGQVR